MNQVDADTIAGTSDPLMPPRLRGGSPIDPKAVTTIRWLALAGQTAALLLVYHILQFDVLILSALGIVLVGIPEKVLVDPYSKGNCLALWDRGAACMPGDNLHKSMRSVIIDTKNYDWEGDAPLKKEAGERGNPPARRPNPHGRPHVKHHTQLTQHHTPHHTHQPLPQAPTYPA